MVEIPAKVAKHLWPQHYLANRPANIPEGVAKNALATAQKLRDRISAPIFTLGHLAHSTGVSVAVLRSFVERREEKDYRTFLLAKGGGPKGNQRGYRLIAIPRADLKAVQRWICDHILCHQSAHSASKAYSLDSKLIDAVEPHLGCRWLIKLDVQAFFDSVSEIPVYRVFRGIGYQPLVAFELARLCTRQGRETPWRKHNRWQPRSRLPYKIKSYSGKRLGSLPQGAPTSPMLSNLVMREFDKDMTALASRHGYLYSRYADDLAFSTSNISSRADCSRLVQAAYALIGSTGLSPNLSKTKVSPPGARKLLLGLLIDGDQAHLTKDLRKRLATHLHFIKKFGPIEHAKRREFDSVFGLRNYLMGLAHYARQIDPAYGKAVLQELADVEWPV